MKFPLYDMSRVMRKDFFELPKEFGTQKIVRGLKYQIYEDKQLYHLFCQIKVFVRCVITAQQIWAFIYAKDVHQYCNRWCTHFETIALM